VVRAIHTSLLWYLLLPYTFTEVEACYIPSYLGAKQSTGCGDPAWRKTCKQNSFCVRVVWWKTQRHRALVQHLVQTKKEHWSC